MHVYLHSLEKKVFASLTENTFLGDPNSLICLSFPHTENVFEHNTGVKDSRMHSLLRRSSVVLNMSHIQTVIRRPSHMQINKNTPWIAHNVQLLLGIQ